MHASQVQAEQDPHPLPLDIQERDFKSFVVGAAGNLVRSLLCLESLGPPVSVRRATWNTDLQSLKGFKHTWFVNCGGFLAEVGPCKRVCMPHVIFVCVDGSVVCLQPLTLGHGMPAISGLSKSIFG